MTIATVAMRATESMCTSAPNGGDDDRQPFVVRRSGVHGLGVFTTRELGARMRVLEYTGERITHGEAAARYDDERADHTHTLLFTVDRSTVIDAGAGGGPARYMNHSCQPNCAAFLEDGRIFFETLRAVPAGAELAYDYRLHRPRPLPRDWRRRYACRCAAPRCRGTMLARPPAPATSGRTRAPARAGATVRARPRTATAIANGA